MLAVLGSSEQWYAKSHRNFDIDMCAFRGHAPTVSDLMRPPVEVPF